MTEKNYKSTGRIILAVAGIITIASVFLCRDLKFDYNFENFFPDGDKDLQFYLDYRKQYEYENEFVLIGIENRKGIFRKDFLRNVQALSDNLKNIPNVERVVSPSGLKQLIIGPLGLVEIPWLHTDKPEEYSNDSSRIFSSKQLPGSFFGKDAKSLCIYLKTTEGISKIKSDTLLFRLQRLIGGFHFEKTYLAGKLKAQHVYVDMIKSEFVLFFLTSLFLVILFLYLAYRSFRGIWVPIVIVLLAITWTLGFMSLINKPLDLMTVLLPTMMFIVGMSDVVHIISRYNEEYRVRNNNMEALRTTLRDVGMPTFITLLTTVIGFLTLLYTSIKPLRDFGIYTSLGVTVAFILSFTLLPALMLITGKGLASVKQTQSGTWELPLHTLFLWVMRNKKMIWTATLLLLIVSIYGITKIRVNNYLLEALAKDNDLKRDFEFFEKNYSGVRPFELSLQVTDSSKTLLDGKILGEMDKLERFLEQEFGIGFSYSPLSLIKSINQSLNSGNPDYYKIPETEDELDECIRLLKKHRKKKELKLILSPDFQQGRITGKMKDFGSAEIKIKNKKLEHFFNHEIRPVFRYQVTGAATLIDKNNEELVLNMIWGLLTSVLLVGIIIALIHRSLKMVVISIIPNLIPMLLVGGLMGYFGIELKTSTAIIFSIAFGIATDDTIHMLGRLKIELSKGRSVLYAIKRSYLSTGKAVLITSLILSAGFLSLILSDFESTFYFGLLVSITLLIAVITELVLLPLLLLWMKERGKNPEFN